MKKIIKNASLLIMILIVISACSEENIESKNMEQIYKDEGVPVRTEKIEKKAFVRELTYNTILSGIKESSASAMMGGRIEKVLVKVGDFVNKDQVIITFPMDSPATQYYQAKVAFENSKNMFERYQKLYEVGGISAQDLDNVQTQFEVNKANWDAVKKMVKVLAPISGYVTKIAVKESDDVRKESVLATIADLRKLKASIHVAEDEIGDISVGTKAKAIWQGNLIEGKVTQVAMAMDPMSQSFNADIEFNNEGQKVKAGVTADVIIAGGTKAEAFTVQRKNLVKKGEDFYAFIAVNNVAKERKIMLGKSSGLFVEVIEGLNENDLMIVEGQMFLQDNVKIKIIK